MSSVLERRSASTCEGRRSGGLTACLSFITYPDVTQLSEVLSGKRADHCCPLCLHDDSGMTGRREGGEGKGVCVLGALTEEQKGASSHHINIVHPWARPPPLSQHLVLVARGDSEVKAATCVRVNIPRQPFNDPTTAAVEFHCQNVNILTRTCTCEIHRARLGIRKMLEN